MRSIGSISAIVRSKFYIGTYMLLLNLQSGFHIGNNKNYKNKILNWMDYIENFIYIQGPFSKTINDEK